MELIETIMTRQSTPKLTMPTPSDQQLNQVLNCGIKAPDHGRLRPWHFLLVKESGLDRLGEVFVEAALRNGDLADGGKQGRLKGKPRRAPLIIVAIAEVTLGHKVPEVEQIVAVGAAVQNMQLALHSMGYGSMWRTGSMASDDYVKQQLGFASKDEIVGFLYVGTAEHPPRQAEKLNVEDYCRAWPEESE
jgi:nitroreductase